MCVHSWAMQSHRIGLILVLESVVFHYSWLKCLFGPVTIYTDILFPNFCLKCKIEREKKKSWPLFFNILGRSEKGKQTYFLGHNKIF